MGTKYCRYEITNIENTGNTVTVFADCNEGQFEPIKDIVTGEVVNVFVPTVKFASISASFDKCPVFEEEYKAKLLFLLNQVKGGREIV